APRIFIAGTPVPLMLAVNLYVTAELLQRSQAQNVPSDADGYGGRPQKDAGCERTRGSEVPAQTPSMPCYLPSNLPTLLADHSPQAQLHAPPACGFEVLSQFCV
ncbi:SEC14, partial [Symbiodinium necroappetens]